MEGDTTNTDDEGVLGGNDRVKQQAVPFPSLPTQYIWNYNRTIPALYSSYLDFLG